MADNPDFTPVSVKGNRVPVTEDTAFNQLSSTGDAPNYSGGYYGESTFASGGGWEPLSDQEQVLVDGHTLAQSAILNNYDQGPVFSKTNETTSTESAFGPNAKYYDFSKMSPEEIAKVGKLGAEPTNKSPDSKIDFSGPILNPLHSYPSWTYGISLHMLTKDDYNSIVQNQNYVANRVIIASAGRYNNTPGPNQFIRAPHFDVDFYFDNLNLSTVIGLNDHSRATNAISISFNIIEPYGITLLNRILKLTNEINPENENYLDQPYLLQIDFFGIDETGEIVGQIPNQTKKIPIRILKFDVKVSNKGAEYSIQASPYNHSAYDLGTVSTPAHFEVVAGTVATFFQSNEAEIAAIRASAAEQRETQQNTGIRNATANGLSGGVIGPDGQITYVNGTLLSPATRAAAAAIATGDPVYRVKSYGSAINAWQDELKNSVKVTYADKYYFNFDPEIAKSDFDLNGKLGPKDTPMVDVANTNAHRKGNLGIEILALDYKTRVFSINAGTSIEQVINYVIRNSSYITNQMVVPEEIGTDPQAYVDKKKQYANKPLMWYKIIPTIRLLEFDKIRKQWAREITYNVVPYEVYNTKLAIAPQGVWTDPIKEYNYIYTGKNVDVIDFQIEFNALYYTAVTAYRGYISATSGMPIDEEQKIDNPQTYDGVENAPNAIMPMKEKPQTLDARARATGGDNTATKAAAVDVEQSLYTTAGADMLQARLKIIGDPMYIKQDDIFYSPTISLSGSTPAQNNTVGDPRLIANGSLKMDNREVYIQVSYRTPSDIDESTGLMKFDNNYLKSLFSGMYRVLTVNSTFSGGQFIQTLETVRLPRQASLDNGDKNTSKTNQRTVDGNQVPGSAAMIPPETISPYTNGNGTTGDNIAPGNSPVQEVETPVTNVEQAKLAEVNNTAPTQTIDTKHLPPSLGNDATDAALAENYRYKAQWFAAKAAEERANGSPATADSYQEQVAVYEGYAARRQAMANGTLTE